ncbi:hypothetical protein B0J13DRAFT_613120 [Dactylonectria estremocensis]|uniref:NmrA-like domain-containing protein n=1 Tax=Dactylonectria estremocensis TaxID=1079267 RepID=A0A9P9IEX9_9HYPO|nr:hypothetical protein B0J13DRAFT_613120 [Dactylonectria estremocensis]
MNKIAIAGGSESLGKAVVDGIRAGKHEYVILSRKPQADPHVIAVDYSDVQGLRDILEKENVHTVISTMGLYTPAHHRSQMSLIEAAELAGPTKRFIPSEFGFHIKKEHGDLQVSFPFKLQTVERLENTGLEFTLVNTGVFLDYLVWPKIPSHMRTSTIWINLAQNLAALPGDGNQMVAFTHTRDIGRFVAALLDLPKWERRYCAIGDRLTLNEIVQIAEEVKGTTFNKKYDSEADLVQGRCTLLPDAVGDSDRGNEILPSEVVMEHLAGLGIFVVKGFADLDPKTSIRNVFPKLDPLTVRSAIQKWVEVQSELRVSASETD